MDAAKEAAPIKGQLFVISGPSGAGKTVLTNGILDEYGNQYNIRRVVTYTTRAPRKGELQGVDYHFVSKEQFEDLIYKEAFLEWNKWGAHYYGTPSNLLEHMKDGTSYIIILDRNGAKAVHRKLPQSHLIWIEAPNLDVLKERLCNRGSDSMETIQKRLCIAEQEIRAESEEKMYQNCIKNLYLKDSLSQLGTLIVSKIRAEN